MVMIIAIIVKAILITDVIQLVTVGVLLWLRVLHEWLCQDHNGHWIFSW